MTHPTPHQAVRIHALTGFGREMKPAQAPSYGKQVVYEDTTNITSRIRTEPCRSSSHALQFSQPLRTIKLEIHTHNPKVGRKRENKGTKSNKQKLVNTEVAIAELRFKNFLFSFVTASLLSGPRSHVSTRILVSNDVVIHAEWSTSTFGILHMLSPKVYGEGGLEGVV